MGSPTKIDIEMMMMMMMMMMMTMMMMMMMTTTFFIIIMIMIIKTNNRHLVACDNDGFETFVDLSVTDIKRVAAWFARVVRE